MTDDRSKALVPQGSTSLSPLSRLAERTLAERVEREERALVAARTFVVGPGGYTTITEAVKAARDGDTILVRPGRYEESVVVQGKAITIRGDGERDAIVVGWDEGPVFRLVETRSTLTGLTISGGDRDARFEVIVALRVTGGAPQLDGLRVTNGRGYGIVFEAGAAGAIGHSQIDGHNRAGISVDDGASPRIEENEIWANSGAGISIGGGGSDPLVRANRVHDGGWSGIFVAGGASPRIEENEIWANTGAGISIGARNIVLTGLRWNNAGTDPLVRANRVHDGVGPGILVWGGASPRIEENQIWANALAGIDIRGRGTDPLVRANRVHHGQGQGIFVHDGKTTGIMSGGASPRIEGNEIWANRSAGIWISGAGTSPVIVANTVRDGLADGICVLESASPTVTGNTVTGNALEAIRVDEGAEPKIGRNVVSP
jgi:parallel beta-helix repeat protein